MTNLDNELNDEIYERLNLEQFDFRDAAMVIDIIRDLIDKQVKEAMAKFGLKKGVKYDIKSSDKVIVITPLKGDKE